MGSASILKKSGPPARLFGLVPAAGSGQRAGADGPKQYALVGGRCVVARTLDALVRVSRLQATLVIVSPDDAQFERQVTDLDPERVWLVRCGGATRAETVANGLRELTQRGAAPDDWILVHDAARCLIEPVWVDRLIDACIDDDVGGLLALPVADTLKQEVEGRAVATLARTDKWVAQTPQMFRLQMLQVALAKAGAAVTDEASAIEALGLTPRLVRGHARNIKLTWPEDFDIASALLARPASGTP